MRIGLIDLDARVGGTFPNLAQMKIAAYHKGKGDEVEWANPLWGGYNRVYISKLFTFTPDTADFYDCEIIKGGTGFDIESRLPDEIEAVRTPDYSIYPNADFSVQFLSRGCIRKCPFCLVSKKEGYIRPVEPLDLNPKGKWIEVLDNNFFANPEWKKSVDYLIATKQKVNLHGVDIRIMNEEQAYWLNKLKLKTPIHIAWDLPTLDLTEKLKEVTKYIKPYKMFCYVLIGFNSTIEQDLYRLYTLRELKILPFVQPYRDFDNNTKPSQYEMDLAHWANRMWYFNACRFEEFEFRKGFKGIEYLKHKELCKRK